MYHGGGGMRPGFDQIMCAVHRKKRSRADMMPWNEQPGRWRCRLHKECHKRDSVEMVTCHIHNRRRNMNQMHEVRRDVWGCTPQHPCRQFGNGPAWRLLAPHGVQQAGFTPYAVGPRHARGPHDFHQGGRERFTPASVSAWLPAAAPAAGGGGAALQGRFGRRDPRMPGFQADRKVWCVRHGKPIPASHCEFVQDCCHICQDNSMCLSTPLEAPEELMKKPCTEMLCARHNTLRSVGFLEINLEKNGYQCVAGHPCRGTTLNNMKVSAPQPAAEDVEVLLEQGATEVVPPSHYPDGRGAENYVAHSSKELVSSFFV